MIVEVKVPQLSESVSEATLLDWHKKEGEPVKRDENLIDIETDKVVLELPAPADGVLVKIIRNTKDSVGSGEVIAQIDTEAKSTGVTPKPAAPVQPIQTAKAPPPVMPAAQKIAAEKGVDTSRIQGTGCDGRVTKGDVLDQASRTPAAGGVPVQKQALQQPSSPIDLDKLLTGRPEQRVPMSRLGFMSFFVKASVHALKRYPVVNASIDGTDIVYHGYFDIGVAVGSPRGLVVPILRDADRMSSAEIEKKIGDSGKRAQDGKLGIEELTGGTFSISNGGVFGSMLSTPIITPPQSAILGVHATKERAVVENGEIVARPMNYLALSYDHRIIDGREAVLFLVGIKEALEDPARLILEI